MSERDSLRVLRVLTAYLLIGCILTGNVISACASSETSTETSDYTETETSDYTETETLEDTETETSDYTETETLEDTETETSDYTETETLEDTETETSDYTETETLEDTEPIDPNTSETTDKPTWSPKSTIRPTDFTLPKSTIKPTNFTLPKSTIRPTDFTLPKSTIKPTNFTLPKSTIRPTNFTLPKSTIRPTDFTLPKSTIKPTTWTPKSTIDKPINYPQTKEPKDNGEFSASVQLYGEKTDVTLGEDILLRLSAVNLITKPTMSVQVILLPPSGMSVTSSEFVQSGAGQYTTTYELEPGQGKDIEVRIKSNQAGNFDVEGRVIYYFDGDRDNPEYDTLNLPIKVKEGTPSDSQLPSTDTKNAVQSQNQTKSPGFGSFIALLGLLTFYTLRKRVP
ncbi:MAG: hypothetical protein PHG79_11075 [Methanosarcina sp.]|nr:hypothetical protein [Methanosarcina sp.]